MRNTDLSSESEVIVIGSGIAALHAAYPLVEAGVRVTMLDVGYDGADVLETGVPMSFEDHRRFDAAQSNIFLGDDFSGIGADEDGAGHAGAMTSGRRSFITRGTKKYAEVRTHDAVVTQSLARGGLSEGWGAVCGFLSDEELHAIGLSAAEMKPHYAAIIDHIGVSGINSEYDLQPSSDIDDLAQRLKRTYESKQTSFSKLGFRLEQPALALLTRDKGSRKATTYRDMDFWDNIGQSVYRGHYTLEMLCTHSNFNYIPNILVQTIAEETDGIVVKAIDICTDAERRFHGSKAIVAAGAINTTRILLRSFGKYDEPISINLKNNYLIPSLLLSSIGRAGGSRRHSLCQLVMSKAKAAQNMTDTYIQIYSYKSLLLYKLLRYVPLPIPEALSLLSMIAPSLVLADVRLAELPGANCSLTLRKDEHHSEYLEIICADTPDYCKAQKRKVRAAARAIRKLGLFPLTIVRNPFGATTHYAGGVPFCDSPDEQTLGTKIDGSLHQSPHIYVADSATWKSLPAKAPALTIMANANRVGTKVLDSLRRIPT